MTDARMSPLPQGGQVAITPMEMLERAVSSGADVVVMERLMELHERWHAGQARVAFSAAITALRKDLPAIVKSRSADFGSGPKRTSYKYEDLAEIVDAISDPLAKHGLSFRWRTDSTTGNGVSVTCILEHSEGHFEETTLSGPLDNSGNKNAIQAIGSIVTYLQRYTLKAALGIAASQDDDGRQGAGAGQPPRWHDPPGLDGKWLKWLEEWREFLGDERYQETLADFDICDVTTLSEDRAGELIAVFKKMKVDEALAPFDRTASEAAEQAPNVVSEPDLPHVDNAGGPEPRQEPQEPARADRPTLEVYRALCGLYKATLGEDLYHELLTPFTEDESGKSNAVKPEHWSRALLALYDYTRQNRPEDAPWPSPEALMEAALMKKSAVLEGIAVLEMPLDEQEIDHRRPYLGPECTEHTDLALVAPLRVYHAHLADMAWAGDLAGGEGSVRAGRG